MDISQSCHNEIKNQARLDTEVLNFLSQPRKEVLVAFDFDECLVIEHASQLYSQTYCSEQNHNSLVGCSDFKSIVALMDLNRGLSLIEYQHRTRCIAARISWRPGALEVITELEASSRFEPVVISSGLRAIPEALFNNHKLSSFIFASAPEFDIVGQYRMLQSIVTAHDKGYIMRQLRATSLFKELYAIGHSTGDVEMLREAVGISLADTPTLRAVANYTIIDLSELAPILLS